MNKVEQARIDAMRPWGCVACATLGLPNVQHLELHHILDINSRFGDWHTIFLCRGHHQGDLWSAEQLELIPEEKRVSLRHGRKLFTLYYPTERELWERVQQKLGLPDTWPPSKVLPRGWRVHTCA